MCDSGEILITEPVMSPIIALLVGALLIAIGVNFPVMNVPWIGIVVSMGGVATIIVGIVMLVVLAKRNTAMDGKIK